MLIPDGEQSILRLRDGADDRAGLVLARARQYYEAEKRFRVLIENSSDGILVTAPEGNILYASPSNLRLLGHAPEELLGRNGLDFIHREDRATVVRRTEDALACPRLPVRVEGRLQGSGGEWRWVEALLTDLSGEPAVAGIVWNYRDMTDRKRTEQALRHANEGLEQFAYAAAHDLQEPIRTIALYTELLARRYGEKLDDGANEFVKIALEGARRMQTLVQDLLAFTRSLDEPQDEDLRTDANEVVEEVTANLRTAIETSGAQVTRERLPELPVYRAHLVQLLQNLVTNALKYRSERPPRIEISATELPDEYVVAVRDNGIGLAICHRIVSHYRGRIWVDSQEGEGCTFLFALPRKQQLRSLATNA